MEYFCYISHSKVDQLYSNIEENQILEMTESSQKNSDKKASGGLSNLFSLFKADISYGRSDSIVRNAKLKETYVSKLKKVITEISIVPFASKDSGTDNVTYSSPYLYFEGRFKVKEIDSKNSIVKIINEENNIFLNCSLKYFSSEPLDKNDEVRIDSANYAFFGDKIPVNFKTVFLYNGNEGKNVFGSPIFLAIESNLRLKNSQNNFILNL